jgi:hypothetical protein
LKISALPQAQAQTVDKLIEEHEEKAAMGPTLEITTKYMESMSSFQLMLEKQAEANRKTNELIFKKMELMEKSSRAEGKKQQVAKKEKTPAKKVGRNKCTEESGNFISKFKKLAQLKKTNKTQRIYEPCEDVVESLTETLLQEKSRFLIDRNLMVACIWELNMEEPVDVPRYPNTTNFETVEILKNMAVAICLAEGRHMDKIQQNKVRDNPSQTKAADSGMIHHECNTSHRTLLSHLSNSQDYAQQLREQVIEAIKAAKSSKPEEPMPQIMQAEREEHICDDLSGDEGQVLEYEPLPKRAPRYYISNVYFQSLEANIFHTTKTLPPIQSITLYEWNFLLRVKNMNMCTAEMEKMHQLVCENMFLIMSKKKAAISIQAIGFYKIVLEEIVEKLSDKMGRDTLLPILQILHNT